MNVKGQKDSFSYPVNLPALCLCYGLKKKSKLRVLLSINFVNLGGETKVRQAVTKVLAVSP